MDYVQALDDETLWKERKRLADEGYTLARSFESNDHGLRQLGAYLRNLKNRNVDHRVLVTSRVFQVLVPISS
jgi:hypothetical protein